MKIYLKQTKNHEKFTKHYEKMLFNSKINDEKLFKILNIYTKYDEKSQKN